ncbi:PH domain-containing protein [Elizabethkingia ursingii]|uniref:PH domain-containing protein n=1 Tax=Elizabethkingia TaxID=308865 RepID=UPI000D479BE9|nr:MULTISPECIES: PH domain-containing protein [Elizabethkingia]MCL1668016.1 PH domain-containing protein [Elizabethkingia ursingii]PUB33635.1 putative oligomerization/nucleic acid binding protein [Elizabethkingia sp. YR214]
MINDLKKFLNEEQDPKAVEKILEKVNGLLTTDEHVDYIAVQKKPAVNISPDCIALTNKRIIFCRPKNFGFAMNFQDYLWKDIADCHMSEGILGATFKIKTIYGFINMLDYLPKQQARKLYQYAQGKEEDMMEYRRQRALEEKRAAAGGGIIVNNLSPATETPNTTDHKEDPLAVLQKLKSLLDNQLISQEEFNHKKIEILERM